MYRWLKRVLLVYTIGGGFLGVVASFQSLQTQGRPIVAITSALFFAFGIASGLLLSESARRGSIATKVFVALQVPAISMPGLIWQMTSAAGFTVYVSKLGWGWTAKYGSDIQFYFGGGRPITIGLNFLALGLLAGTVWLERRLPLPTRL